MESLNPCCCCLLRPSEKDLKTPYFHFGITEIFSKMLEDCFQIHLTLDIDNECGICEVCVGCLRDASNFKLQVQRSQAELQARLGRALHVKGKEPICKLEILEEDNVNNEWFEIPVLPCDGSPGPAQPADTGSVRPEGSQHQVCRTLDHEPSLATLLKQAPATSNSFETQFTTFCLNHKQKETRSTYHCELCSKEFSYKTAYLKHKQNKHGFTRPKLSNKQKETRSTYHCELCSKEFSHNTAYLKHKQTKHGFTRTKLNRRTNSESDKNMVPKGRLINDSPKAPRRLKPVVYKGATCELCGRKFTRRNSLKKHMEKHAGPKRHICAVCGKRFTYIDTLKDHELVHTEEKLYICDICGKRYHRRRDISAHIINIHVRPHRIKCDICDKDFVNRNSMLSHKAIHSDKKPFGCDVCRKQFRRKEHLLVHNMMHSGQKPYSCEFCDQKYRTMTNLKRHKRVHRDENLSA